MKALRLAIVCAFVLCAVGAFAEEETEERTYGLAGLETVEPLFLEETATSEIGGFPIPLTKKQKKTTMEPQYLGEKKVKAWIAPEYALPKPPNPKKKKKGPVVFTTHYFSPMPKPKKGVRYPLPKGVKPKKKKKVPLKSVETPTGLAMRAGYIIPEMINKLPNKVEPKDRSKITLAPAPLAMLVELGASVEEATEAVAGAAVDTTAEANAQAEAETESEVEANPPPFSAEEMGNRQIPTIISGPHEFFEAGFQTPDWSDETAEDEVATEEQSDAQAEESAEPALIEASAETVEEDEETDEFEDEEEEAEADEEEEVEDEADEDEEAADEEADEEDLLEDEEEDEEEEEGETTEVAEGENDEEQEMEVEEEEEDTQQVDEADNEESDEEADEEQSEEEPAFIESAATAVVTDSEDVQIDEMEANEIAAKHIDMDASHDDIDEEDEDEAEGETEEDAEAEQEAEESFDAAVGEDAEADEMSANEAAAELVETDALDTSVDTLLAEIDAHLAAEEHSAANTETETDTESHTESAGEAEAETESETETDTEAEAEADTETETDASADTESKGTPGHAISAGMTWEQAQEARDAEEQAHLEAEKAAAPKVAATVVASTAELHSADAAADMQTPEFDSEEVHVETVAPQLVEALPEQSAQAALLEKIAKLKALRKN